MQFVQAAQQYMQQKDINHSYQPRNNTIWFYNGSWNGSVTQPWRQLKTPSTKHWAVLRCI